MVRMKFRHARHTLRVLSLLFMTAAVLNLSSCATWRWLWSKNHLSELPDTGKLVLDDLLADTEEPPFEGGVPYDGTAHTGTDIYYIGKADSENRKHVIVIDAGHQLKGDSDKEPNGPGSTVMKAKVTYGATGQFTGQLERDLNLAVALLLRDELIHRGYSVVMIRETNEVSISNMERAELANKYNASAYIRIHANGASDPSANGALTISQSASNPYPDCAAHYAESRLLSELVLREFCGSTGIRQRSVTEMDNMTGTNWSRVPTTIVEMGFLSNKGDDDLMSTIEFQRNAAIGMADGIELFLMRVSE